LSSMLFVVYGQSYFFDKSGTIKRKCFY